MTMEWKESLLGELVEIKHGFAFKGEYFAEEKTNDILLTPGNFAIGGGFQWGKLKFYDGPIPSDYILTEGDLVVTMTDLSKASDTLGYSAIVPSSEKLLLHNQRIGKIKTKTNSVDKMYLSYQLRTKTYRNEVLASATGSTVKHTSPSKICAYRFLLPPLDEQKAIASVLGALDDKIENNRRMNETLEEMARAIFKSWFVDFDPVHAKAAGNAPAHMDAETAALFPNSFGDDGLPAGWQMKSLGDIADLSWGDTNTTKSSYVEEGFDAYSASGKDGKLSHFDFERLGIVLSAIGANCGKTWLARGKWSCIKNTIRFWSLNELAPTIYLFHATGRNNFWPLRGSAQPFISQGDARRRSVLIASNGEATHFENFVDKFYKKISDNEDENQTLAELRDTLLPKLMSGEIRVKDAEREVEAAV